MTLKKPSIKGNAINLVKFTDPTSFIIVYENLVATKLNETPGTRLRLESISFLET